MTSEGLEQFVSQVEGFGFTDLPLDRMWEHMSNRRIKVMEYNNYVKRFGADRMSYNLKFKADAEWHPRLAEFAATLLHVPPIEHGTYNRVNTAALEKKMAAIDWNRKVENEEGWHFPRDLAGPIIDVLTGLHDLLISGSSKAKWIGDALRARYWAGTAAESVFPLSFLTQQFEKSHLFTVENKLEDFGAKDAYNLLAGRYVVKFSEVHPDHFTAHWSGLEQTEKGHLVRYEDYDLKAALQSLALEEMKHESSAIALIRSLLEGDLAAGHVTGEGKRIAVFVAADPRNEAVVLYDAQGRPTTLQQILSPVVDPQKETKQSPSRKPPLIKRKPGKNKGRSL